MRRVGDTYETCWRYSERERKGVKARRAVGFPGRRRDGEWAVQLTVSSLITHGEWYHPGPSKLGWNVEMYAEREQR